jgi:hypothetical protein
MKDATVCVLGSMATNQSHPFQKYRILGVKVQAVEESIILESTFHHYVIVVNSWKKWEEGK